MKIFITVTFKGKENQSEIEYLCSLVKKSGFEDFCFVRDIEKYHVMFDDSKELVGSATEEIKNCDALLIDMTNKPTGRAIEAGIAYALGKKIIVIMKKGTKVKGMTTGIADAVVEYEEIEDIVEELKVILHKFKNNE